MILSSLNLVQVKPVAFLAKEFDSNPTTCGDISREQFPIFINRNFYPHKPLSLCMIQIKTERLLLRELEYSDLSDIQEYATDPQVIKYLTFGPNTEQDSRSFIEYTKSQQSQDPRQSYELGIILPVENKLIGGCGIRITQPHYLVGNIGYCLNRKYWGKGYATESALGLLGFGFDDLGFHRIFAICDPENIASRRVLEKIGMQYEGHLRENVIIHGEHRDSLMYAILKQEWKKP
jgi:RimJ/RimL family protein N-acetyltransferase